MPDDEFDDQLGEALSGRFDDDQDEARDADDTGNTDTMDTTSEADDTGTTSDTDTTGDTGTTESPNETDSTRKMKQMPVYLPASRRAEIDQLYRRLSAHYQLEHDEDLEKHADFMQAAWALVLDHREELADRLGVDPDSLKDD